MKRFILGANNSKMSRLSSPEYQKDASLNLSLSRIFKMFLSGCDKIKNESTVKP